MGVSRVGFLGCSDACCYERRQLEVFFVSISPRCYKRRQSEGFFAENGGFLAQIDDVCNIGRPLVARPGPASAHGYRSLAL